MNKNQIRSYTDDVFRKQMPVPHMVWKDCTIERELAYKLSEKAFSNIRDFPYVYFTNGITEAINYLVPQQPLRIYPSEYRYLRLFPTVSEYAGDSIYLSYPYSGNGKFYGIPQNHSVILDCAYMFASNMGHEKQLPPNVTHVLFSLSKSHNLSDYRVGWMFSRTPLRPYHVLQYDYNYTVSATVAHALELANLYEPNFLYKKYKDQLSHMYKENNLVEHDTNLFGTSKDGIRHPWYTLVGQQKI